MRMLLLNSVLRMNVIRAAEEAFNAMPAEVRVTGTRRKICKVCYASGKGVKEIGKLQRVKELLVQGMKRCTDCKNDLLLSEFSKKQN